MREKIIAGNWKMNHDYQTGLRTFSEIINMVRDEVINHTTVVVACPFIHLSSFAQLAQGYGSIYLAAQNCHHEEAGAFTGDVSAAMIQSAGARYVIVGHSERRAYYEESNELIAQKIAAALRHDLRPIYCVGETLQERETDLYESVIKQQLLEGLFQLDEVSILQAVIAYEPVWAIGTGLTASPVQAQAIHAFIRKNLQDRYGERIANLVSILYGGSCNPGNASDLFAQPDIDGGLIGGASLKPRDFLRIIQAMGA